MVKADRQDDERKVADEAASFSNLAEASAKLFAEQAAAMAVMTAYGIGVATQMTGMMLGALRGPAGAAASADEVEPKSVADSNIVHLRPAAPVTAKVRAEARVAKAPPEKSPAQKPAVTKRPPSKPVAKVAAPKPVKQAAKSVKDSVDDLKKISGIGPRLEKVLNDRGIVRFDDIAALGKAALKKLDAELGLEGRVIRDDWAGQAKALSGGKG